MRNTKIFGMVLTLLLIGISVLVFRSQTVRADPATITVPDDYPTIQEAINRASVGDNVYVRTGTYYEHVVVNKSVTLTGESRGAIIDGSQTGVVVSVKADNVTIAGLSIRNGGDYYNGISVRSSDAKLIDNNITNCQCGIELFNTNRAFIAFNIIANNLNGVSGQMWYDSFVTGNAIRDNFLGVGLSDAMRDTVSFNDISDNEVEGILIWGSYQNTIVGNNVLLNNRGNYSSAIVVGESSWNKFYHNNVINWGRQVDSSEAQINTWDDDYPSGGNYWSDYSGVDNFSGPHQDRIGSDGIGDTPYTIATENEDRYPLEHPNPQAIAQLNLTEYYELLADLVNMRSQFDDLLSRYDNLTRSHEALQTELNNLKSEHEYLKDELNVSNNVMAALLITVAVFLVAIVFLLTGKLEPGQNELLISTRLRQSLTSANKRVYAMVGSGFGRLSLTSLGVFYVFLTAVDIAQTLWGFPEHEVGLIAKAFMVLLGNVAWLYFPFRIILTSLIIIAIYKLMTPSVSKKLLLLLSLITLAAVIWNAYTLITSAI